MKVLLLDLRPQYQTIRQEIRDAIDAVCDEQALILGPVVDGFERDLTQYCGVKHAIAVSSGTDALLAVMMAIDIKPGDEVICPSFTFFATAGCVARLGAIPVFVDIDPVTFNIDPALIKSKITKKTRAIVPVHLFGQMADMCAINQIACDHELLVLEDAAQAIGARQGGVAACAHGFAGCLSFYPTKNLGAFGDAGAILCNDDALADRCRKTRVHGSGNTYYHEFVGGNFRIAAIQAAVLRVKLKYLDQWHAARQRNADIYNRAFESTHIVAPRLLPGNTSIYNQYVVRVKDRDQVKKKLADLNIGSAIYYPLPLHQQQCFAYLGYKTGDLPQSERAADEVLALPIFPELAREQVEFVAKTMVEIAG